MHLVLRLRGNEKTPQSHLVDQNMDIDDEDMDDITELKPFSRGRKRDRAEAGSTFGGDDDESSLGNEVDGDSKLRRRRRKRRTVAKRKSEATYLRGKKKARRRSVMTRAMKHHHSEGNEANVRLMPSVMKSSDKRVMYRWMNQLLRRKKCVRLERSGRATV